MTEAHDPLAPGRPTARMKASALIGGADGVQRVQARLGAPPWNGPESAPMAPATAAAASAPVEVMTRAVKVEELNPWSPARLRYGPAESRTF